MRCNDMFKHQILQRRLRQDCVIRDRHRCVATGCFDKFTHRERERELKAEDAKLKEPDETEIVSVDDDGVSLDGVFHEKFEVAHIIPHSLMRSPDFAAPGPHLVVVHHVIGITEPVGSFWLYFKWAV